MYNLLRQHYICSTSKQKLGDRSLAVTSSKEQKHNQPAKNFISEEEK
ncbi:MAG: hypothetical protein RM021_023440 [Nostoc sp. EkiNYC01]|nr:hypothetical protein [Nostoc sp. EkiNYC01]